MILHRLREETRSHHDAVERQLNLLDPALTQSDYVRLLVRFYGFYAPLEARLDQVPGIHELELGWQARRKTLLLKLDLAYFGRHALTDVPLCADLPALESIAQALGCLYVVEGATLGGQIIIRHLRKHLDVDVNTGGLFFANYGEKVGEMWKVFRACVTMHGVTSDLEDTVVSSACETFAAFGRWFQQGEAV